MQSKFGWMRVIVAAAAAALPWAVSAADAAKAPSAKQIARGRYVAMTSGCNDCHTAGYAPTEGKVPESEWLKGDILGWRGPWGTTYPVNLRLFMKDMTADQWVKHAKSFHTRPPMPWFNVRAMNEPDLRALYAYIHSLKPVGDPAPSYVPPDKQPNPPFVQFPAPPK